MGKIDQKELLEIIESNPKMSNGDLWRMCGLRFGVHPDSVGRAARRLGVRMTPHYVRIVVSDDQHEDMVRLSHDGMPGTWVAETVGVGYDTVRDHVGNRAPGMMAEWLAVWQAIRRNPTLLALHREFAPPSVDELRARRSLTPPEVMAA